MSYLQKYVRQVKPRTENYIPPVEKVQNYISEEMTPEAEIQRAIELAELMDAKVASIDAKTVYKEDNKNKITITQVVDDKDRIKYAALAKEIIDAEKEELMSSLEDAAVELQKKSDDIDIDKIKNRIQT